MNNPITIQTKRLILRPWNEQDLESLAAMNADPKVMEYLLGIKSFEESKNEYLAIQGHYKKYGYGFWVVSEIDKNNFVGFIGLRNIDFSAHFTPNVEIVWKLAYPYWGKGYATEGAAASLKHGFEALNLEEVVSLAYFKNQRSIAVMKKIGMHHDPKEDFDHPKLPEGHPLRRHVLYRINKMQWQAHQKEMKNA